LRACPFECRWFSAADGGAGAGGHAWQCSSFLQREIAFVFAAINIVCLFIIGIVLAFLFIELRRFKRMEEEIAYYISQQKKPS
jgi:hypothetical protein